jgi:hypothetical protein
MRLFQLGLRSRLYLGFAVLIAFGLGMAGFSMLGLSNVTESVGKMEAISVNLARVQEVPRQLQVIRRASNRYRIDADPASLSDMKLAEARAAELLAAAAKATLSEQRRKIYNGVAETLRSAITEREAFSRASEVGFAERTKLFDGGDTLTAATGRLVGVLKGNVDPDLSAAGARVESAMLLVRVANWRFLATMARSVIFWPP